MTPVDERRLQRFDAFERGVREDLGRTKVQMEDLRREGQTRTATYQQLYANRAILEEIVARLEDAGL